jgi:conjugal transfer pilus assembly protein TraK
MTPSNCRLLLVAMLSLLADPAPALQVIDARDGETVLAKVSRKDLTRVSVERGRIRRVTASGGDLLIERDEERGEIFLRPAQPDAHRPIQLFVGTDRGTLGLLLQPVDVPGDTLLLRLPPAPGAARPERSARHVRALKDLLLVMAQDAAPEDMEVLDSGARMSLWSGTQLSLQRVWLGQGLAGERFVLTNIGTEPILLAERQFLRPGVMAVSIEQPKLPPGQSTALFLIRERRGDE